MEAQLGESTRRPQAVHLTMADRMSCGFHPHLKKKKGKMFHTFSPLIKRPL